MPSSRWGREIELCKEMGWSWEALQTAPDEMVAEIEVKMEARGQVERERSRGAEGRRRP